MQILESVESISRQRSVEMVKLALLQTLGDNFAEISEAALLTRLADHWTCGSRWAQGRLLSNALHQPCEKRLNDLADQALLNSEASADAYRAYSLQRHMPAQVLLLRGGPVDEAGRRALESVLKIVENFSQLLNEKNRDRLTGLLNRHELEESILCALEQAEQSELGATPGEEERPADWLAILDIDHFKRVNDNYGHLFGDEVLLRVSQLMEESFRRNDKLFRYGGEEFVLILSGLRAADAAQVFERFRERVARHDFPQLGQLTLSIGYTRIARQGSDSAVLGEADRALYWAKQTGRNRCANFEQLLSQGLLDASAATGSVDLF